MKNWHNKIEGCSKDSHNGEEKDLEIEFVKNEKLQNDAEMELDKAIINHFKFDRIKQTIQQAKLENEFYDEKYETISQTIQQAKNENIESKRKRITVYKRISIAATFLVVIGIGWLYSVMDKEKSLFTDILISENGLQNVSAFNMEQIKYLVNEANKAIHTADFESALALTSQLRKEVGFETDEILQNECYIYFKQGKYKKAERQLNSIKDKKLKNEVRWKLSKLYLNEGERTLAKEQLLLIEGSPYKEKANFELNKMKCPPYC